MARRRDGRVAHSDRKGASTHHGRESAYALPEQPSTIRWRGQASASSRDKQGISSCICLWEYLAQQQSTEGWQGWHPEDPTNTQNKTADGQDADDAIFDEESMDLLSRIFL